MTSQLCAHCVVTCASVLNCAESKSGTRTHEPRDEVEAPHGVETDLVYPHGQVEEHNPDRNVRDDDIVPCIEVSFPLGCSAEGRRRCLLTVLRLEEQRRRFVVLNACKYEM